MKKQFFLSFVLVLLLSTGQALAELQVVSSKTSLAPVEVSSLVQAELQVHGFTVRFVQPIDKGLKKYNKQHGYFRVIVFDPPAKDMPQGKAGDMLHAFIPLRIAVKKLDKGTQVSALPYADMLYSMPAEAKQVVQQWDEVVRGIIEGLPE